MEFATIVKFALPFLRDFGTELLANLVVCSLLPLFKKQKKEKMPTNLGKVNIGRV